MNTFGSISIDISDLIRTCIIVSDNNWLISPQKFPKHELYLPFNYLRDEISESRVLIDRNIASYLVKFYGGIEPVINKENSDIVKTIAAYMVFFQLSNIQIEPNIAYYEYADSTSYENVKENYIRLQVVNNFPTPYFINTALGRKTELTFDLNSIRSNLNLSVFNQDEITKKPKYYTFNNIHIKKALLISQINDSPSNKFREYINWAWAEFLLSAPATLFIILFFQNRYGGIIKRNLPITDCIRNATWDLALVQLFCKYVKEEHEKNKRWYLLTNDNALKDVANFLLIPEEYPVHEDELLSEIFEKYWDKKNWKYLYEEYRSLVKNSNSKNRKVKNLSETERVEYFKKLNDSLDEQIRISFGVQQLH